MLSASLQKQDKKVNVLIIDDHELTCMGLKLGLKERDNIEVVGVAKYGSQGIELARYHKPDVILMDLKMPEMDGITATKAIKEQMPDCRVIILTSSISPEEVQAALAAKANAFCTKDVSIARLCQVIQMVSEGGFWLDQSIVGMVLQDPHFQKNQLESSIPQNMAPTEKFPIVDPKISNLTKRELEIVRLIVAGKSNKEVADILNIALHTTKSHLSNIYNKLGVNDRTQMAVLALNEGII